MRTIKFRGKRLDNGEWVYGDGNKWDVLYGKVGKELVDLLLDATEKLKEKGVI